MSSQQLLTTREVAERLRVNSCTVRRWRLDDVGPRFLKVGLVYRYPEAELEALDRRRCSHLHGPMRTDKLPPLGVRLTVDIEPHDGPRVAHSGRAFVGRIP